MMLLLESSERLLYLGARKGFDVSQIAVVTAPLLGHKDLLSNLRKNDKMTELEYNMT